MKLKKSIIGATVALLLTGCGGPSSSDVEMALNNNLEQVRAISQLTTKGEDICPLTSEDLEKEVQLKQTCVILHSHFEIDSVSNCIEKGESKYACKFDGYVVSERYGKTESSAEGVFEETPSGWISH